jgi:hypothetical protein
MITSEELLERILILTTVNSTLIHALLSIEAQENIGPKQIKQLETGVRAVRESVSQALSGINNTGASGTSFVDDTIKVILTHLERIETALKKLEATRAKLPKRKKVQEVPKAVATAQRMVTEATLDLAQLTGKPFQRRLSISDKEKLLPPIQQLLDKYSSRSHLLLPNFWFEACRELFRYSEPREIIIKVNRIAGGLFYDLVRSLVSEAPCAGLLQELLRKGSTSQNLTTSEQNKIITDAREFYDNLQNALKVNSIKDSVTEAKRTLRSFDWGPPDVEKRVVGIFYRSARELADRAADSKALSDQERIINAELSRYLCQLTISLHSIPRFHQLLTDMKV